jgi:hypothetical protein
MTESSPKKLWINTPNGKAFIGGIAVAIACRIFTPIANTYKPTISQLAVRNSNYSEFWGFLLHIVLPIMILLGVLSAATIFLRRYGFEGFKFREQNADKPVIAYLAFFNGCILTVITMMAIAILLKMFFDISF